MQTTTTPGDLLASLHGSLGTLAVTHLHMPFADRQQHLIPQQVDVEPSTGDANARLTGLDHEGVVGIGRYLKIDLTAIQTYSALTACIGVPVKSGGAIELQPRAILQRHLADFSGLTAYIGMPAWRRQPQRQQQAGRAGQWQRPVPLASGHGLYDGGGPFDLTEQRPQTLRLGQSAGMLGTGPTPALHRRLIGGTGSPGIQQYQPLPGLAAQICLSGHPCVPGNIRGP